MAIDIIARGLASSLLGQDGKISSDKLPTIGAVPTGTQFYPVGALTNPALIEGKSIEEILLMMLYGVVNPTLTNPSFSVELTSDSIVIVGKPTAITGIMKFDRGAIAPAYGTSGYRSGAATGYYVNDTLVDSANFSIEILPIADENVISCKVEYAEGEQPLNSIGQPYNSPLGAGALIQTISVIGVYPIYTSDGAEMEFTYFNENDEEGYQTVLATETPTTKQAFAVSANKKVVGFKQFEPYTQTWMWIGGSAEASLTYFDTEIITGENLDSSSYYVLFTHNGSLTGERELRIYVE